MDNTTVSRSYDHVIGSRVYQILASTTHGFDIYHRVFNSLFVARVIASSEESIFLVRTPNDLVLFPGYANTKFYYVEPILCIFAFFEFI